MATEQPIVTVQGSLSVPDARLVTNHFTAGIPFGARVGVVCADTAVRSGVLRTLSGGDHGFAGSVHHAEGISIGLLADPPQFDEAKDVRRTILEGVADLKALLQRFDTLNREMASPLHIDEVQELSAEQTRLYKRIDAVQAWQLDRRMIDLANALRCPPDGSPMASLSTGDRRRVALCRLLMSSPDLLLLDDPTAYLDVDSIAWLESFLAAYPGTVVAATNDRALLDAVADRILDIEAGNAALFEGGYRAWTENQVRQRGADDSAGRALARDLRWVGASADARQAARQLRVADYAGRLRAATDPARSEGNRVPSGPALDAPAIEAEGLGKASGDLLVIDALTMVVPPGAVIGVIGPEGAGKSTLLHLLAGVMEPDAGTVRLCETALPGVVDTEQVAGEGERTVREVVADGLETVDWTGHSVSIQDYLSAFGLDAIPESPIGGLTPGRRYLAQLARVLRTGPNLLFLDEPEGDIDLDSRRILEAVLDDFVGSAFIVSHDRWLLDRVATHMLAFVGDSRLTAFEGGYQDYRLDRRRRQGAAVDRPHRLRFKRVGA